VRIHSNTLESRAILTSSQVDLDSFENTYALPKVGQQVLASKVILSWKTLDSCIVPEVP
jgi:hypothetical protein